MTRPRTRDRRTLKNGPGYQLVLRRDATCYVVGLHCLLCERTTWLPADIDALYCPDCRRFFPKAPDEP